MKQTARYLILAVTAVVALLMFGFVIFAVSATHEADQIQRKADAIVVLTGAGNRIMVGGRLLSQGSAGRMLISGVNRKVRDQEIRRLARISNDMFSCCVDVGYEAQDTIGNAVETRKWVHRRGVKRLIVVTSSYHMPRSLTELRVELPEIELIAYPVVPRGLKEKPWWLSYALTRTLASEYVKFLPSAIRYAAAKYLQPLLATNSAASIGPQSR